MATRGTRAALVLKAAYRILGSRSYRDKLFTPTSFAAVVNVEYQLSADAAVTEKDVQSMIRTFKPQLAGSEFTLPWREGCSKPSDSKGAVVPIYGTKKRVGRGSATNVIGWTASGGSENWLVVSDAGTSASLRIGAEEKRTMADGLSGSTGSSNSNSGDHENQPPNGTGVPTSQESTAAETVTTPSAATDATRISPQEADTAPERISSYIYTDGKYYEVPGAAVADLQHLLDSYECKEIRSPLADLGQDEDDGIGGMVGTNPPPKHTGVKIQFVGKGAMKRGVPIPSSHTLIRNSDYNTLAGYREFEKKVFIAGKCVLSLESPLMKGITFARCFCPNLSDVAYEKVLGSIFQGMYGEMQDSGVPINGRLEDVAKAVPSKSKLSECMYISSAREFALVINIIISHGVEYVFLGVDHGTKDSFHHFVKVLHFDSPVWKRVLMFVLDIDVSGSKAADASEAIKVSLDKIRAALEAAGVVVILDGVTSDAGGGAGVNPLHGALLSAEVIDEMARKISCSMHNLNLALSNAWTKVFGPQGIGVPSISQLCMLLFYTAKCYDKETRDKLWREAIANAYHDEGDRDKIRALCEEAFELFDEIVNGDDAACAFDSPELIARCVLTRWLYAVLAVKHLRDNWYGWAAFLTAVVKLERSGNKAHTYASTALDLMSIRPPVPDDVAEGDPTAVFVAPATEATDTAPSSRPTSTETTGSTTRTPSTAGTSPVADWPNAARPVPSFFAIAEFITVWCELFFTPHYEFMKKKDPRAQRHGCLSGHMAVRYFLLHDALDGMADNWQQHPAFQRYLNLIERYQDLGEAKLGGREYFFAVPGMFAKEYLRVTRKHFSQWQSSALVPYVFAGDQPEVSSELARYIVAGIDLDLDVDSQPQDDNRFTFRDKQITLPFHQHKDDDGPPTVSLGKLMRFIVERADIHMILQHELLEEYWHLLRHMADAGGTIRIYDPSTYPASAIDEDGDSYYSCFADMCAARMIAHPSHNQEAEATVNKSRRTHAQNRTEEKRSATASFASMGLDSIMPAAIKEANATKKADDEEAGKQFKPIKRPAGSTLMVPLLAERMKRDDDIDRAVMELPTGTVDTIVRKLKGEESLTKRKRAEMFNGMESKLQKTRKKRRENGKIGRIYISAAMGGEIEFSVLKKSKGHERYLLAELDHRHVEYDAGPNGDGWNVLKAKLRKNEYGRLQEDGVRAFETEETVKSFVPLSELMIENMDNLD